jgi:hypothetical protein
VSWDRSGWWVFATSAAITLIFFIDLCGWVYHCGCRSWWAGAATHCNIHSLGAKHCPWCEEKVMSALSLGAILCAQAGLGWRPRRWNWRRRLAASLVVFPIVGSAAALLVGWLSGYFFASN